MNIESYLNNTIHNNKLQKINKDIYLTNYEISILKTNHINYETCSSYQNIIFLIEEELQDTDNDELELVANSISERNYYQNTHK